MATFERLYKGLLLRCPDIPTELAEEFIRVAYAKCLDESDWSATRKIGEWVFPTPYSTGTISLTNGLNTVTGTGTTFTTSMTGLQLKVSSGPFYTITYVSPTSLTLDRVYGGTTDPLATYTISKVYVTPNSDFASLVSVVDPVNTIRLRLGYMSQYLDARDPQRSYIDTPRLVTGISYSTAGLPRFEVWPRPGSAMYLTYTYLSKVDTENLEPDDEIISPIGGEVIMASALYALARHPGTNEKPNPYFNLSLASSYLDEYKRELGIAMRKDQAIYLTDFWLASEEFPYAPAGDLNYARDHDPLVWPL